MKQRSERFFEEHGPIAVLIIWTAVASLVVSTVSLLQYDNEGSMSPDRFEEGFPGILTMESENQTVENLTHPTLIKDVKNFSVYLPPGEQFFSRVTMSKAWSVLVTNGDGKIVSRSEGKSSGGGFRSGGGKVVVENGSWHRFEFEGIHIIQFGDWDITRALHGGNKYSGSTKTALTTFRFEVPEGYGHDHMDNIVFNVDVKNTRYNLIIYDGYFNVVVNKTSLEGFRTLEYRDLGSHFNYVMIETESENAEIEISIGREEVDTKMNDYITIVIVLTVTTIIVIGTWILLFGKTNRIDL